MPQKDIEHLDTCTECSAKLLERGIDYYIVGGDPLCFHHFPKHPAEHLIEDQGKKHLTEMEMKAIISSS